MVRQTRRTCGSVEMRVPLEQKRAVGKGDDGLVIWLLRSINDAVLTMRWRGSGDT